MMNDHPESGTEMVVAEMYKDVLAKDISLWRKKVLLNEIRKLMPVGQNRWNIRWIIWALALVAIASPAIFFTAAATGANLEREIVPDSVIALSSAALGALSAYITSLAQK